MKRSQWLFSIIMILSFYSCQEAKPYHQYEQELVAQVCKCVSLNNLNDPETFLEAYEKCSGNTSELLQSGLDKYPEDSRLSKKEYKSRLSKIITDIMKYNKCN